MVVYQFLGMLGRPVKQRASRKKNLRNQFYFMLNVLKYLEP